MFMRMQTQWHVSMAGHTGLNYQTLQWFCDVYNVEDIPAMVDGIRTMERAALETMAKQREETRP